MNMFQMLNMFAMMSSLAVPNLEKDGGCYFLTESEAVIAAANIYNPLSIQEDREYMGAIYKTAAGFQFTVNAGRKSTNRISMSIPEDDFDSVVAFWHTHGDAAPSRRYFSDTDTHTALKYSRPFYLADYTGYLKVFTSGDKIISKTTAQRLGLPAVRGYSTGKLVMDAHHRAVRVATKKSVHYS
ncbi:MAG: DUF4329 domain-containing protein [Pseudohongiellaceae bacterium]